MRLIDGDALKGALELQQASYARIGATERAKAYADCMWEIDQAPTVGGWISVKDMIPEMYKAVLGYAPYHHNIWAVTMHENGEWYIWSPQSKRYDPDLEGPITHWMPMPEPPKEVGGDAAEGQVLVMRRDRIPDRKGIEKQRDGQSALRHDMRDVQTVLRAGGDR